MLENKCIAFKIILITTTVLAMIIGKLENLSYADPNQYQEYQISYTEMRKKLYHNFGHNHISIDRNKTKRVFFPKILIKTLLKTF